MKTFLLCLFSCIFLSGKAQSPVLKGFDYTRMPAPTGKEWESPEQLALNKEQPRTWFFTFADIESARRLLPEYSNYYQSLDGKWKFHWAGNPDERLAEFYRPEFNVSGWDDVNVPMQWNVAGIQKDGSLKYGIPVYANQPVIFQHKVAVDDWKGGVMRTPPTDWVTYKHRNEVGSYRRNFTLPDNWKDRQVYINFDGVSSFFYLWINGQYIGFSKNSRNTASFDITPYLNKKGENTVAIEVYRNSDGSFLEAQDMFRLPGIFRSVSLTSTAKIQVRDFRVFPDLDAQYENGSIRIETDIRNLRGKTAKGYTLSYTLYANELYSDANQPVDGVNGRVAIAEITPGETVTTRSTLPIERPRKWSAESPYRYTLVGCLKDRKGKVVETFSTSLGFCKVEIKDTRAEKDEFGLAGRYYYINGKTAKLKGVNRQEIHPASGNAITPRQMQEEILLMKRGNINHVRNSHYSCHPYWYYLCDKYGIYLEDEANIESHQYYYGAASLSHVPEFEAAHVARVMELAHSHVNHPSVVIWSLGNEAGPGKNFVTAYEALHAFDPSRPVQYERNNAIVDMGSNQYPSIAWMQGAVTGRYNIKYPFHISEYAHSMGNAAGNLSDYWQAIESTNFICGAAIWDWVDQALYYYDRQTGERFWAYGGDFGDKPNSGMFCMNGILLPDHSPKPAFYEVKKVYQPVEVKAIDIRKGEIEIFNKNYFQPLSDYRVVWSLYKDGEQIGGISDLPTPAPIGPRRKMRYTLPFDYNTLEATSEYFVKIQFTLAQDKPWAKAGFVQMEEQLPVKSAASKPSLASVTATSVRPEVTEVTEGNGFTLIRGKNFRVQFDNTQGTIYSLEYGGKPMIREGKGPKPDALRAPTDNDNWAYRQWFEKGLHNLKHKVIEYARIPSRDPNDPTVQLLYTIESQAPNAAILEGGTSGKYRIRELPEQAFGPDDFKFITRQIWTVYPDGSLELQSDITSNDPSFVLARLGYALELPEELGHYTYYGRGPWNNYKDRRTGSFIELYRSTVKEQFVPFPKPQSMGNREEVRWCALTDNSGDGLVFIPGKPMSASALPWSALELTLAPHPYRLPNPTATHLHLDVAATGLGGNSCGQGGPLEPDRVKADHHTLSLIIRPVYGAAFTETARVAPSGEVPISITRSREGMVSINTSKKNAPIVYTLNGSKKKQLYTGPFPLRQGGTVNAHYKDHEAVTTHMTFGKIESIPMKVVNASSQENGSGNAAHLVDNDPHTLWHTMYSVTVAQHPHWVDFDAGAVITIKGFTYLPRQDDSSNGDIRDYTLQVSLDGKTWSDPVVQGTFEKNKKQQKILLGKAVPARYIRFTALNSQNGSDYAGGAEFSVIAD